MRRTPPNRRRPLGRATLLWLGLTLLSAAMALAGTNEETPDAIPAGPFFFAPWFNTEVLADDNIFRRSEAQNPAGDVATTVRAGVTASIPIRMSNLDVGYEGSTFFYRDASFTDTETHTGFAIFDLNFSSSNTLRIEESYTNGFTELQRVIDADPGGVGNVSSIEIIRQGVPYTSNEWAVEWQRYATRRPAWRARIERSDLRYKPQELPPTDAVAGLAVPWLDREGWNVEYEYQQPIYRRGRLVGLYEARREDQFEPGPTSNWSDPAVPDSGVPDSVPLRREEYDGLSVGFRGLIGRNQPLIARIGYGKLAFRDIQGSGEKPSDFEGIVGNINWRLPLGGLSNMSVSLNRRPLSSIFNTYYIINEVRARFDRRFKDFSQWGVNLLASSNRYGDLVETTANNLATVTCTDIVRHDRGQQFEGFWEWIVQPRMSVRLTGTHNRRNSNCEKVSYRSNALGMTFKVGWF
jgi:hypothetical protein